MNAEEKRIKLVIDLWTNKEMSGTEIALELGTTRAAVQGMLYRLRQKGLIAYRKDHDAVMGGRRKAAEPQTPRHREPETPHFAPVTNISKYFSSDPIITSKNPLTVIRLQPRHCRYSIGRTPAGEHVFCGETRKPGKSMCPEHHARCYYPAKEHKDRNPDAKKPGQKFSLRIGTSP